jgi:hypothetical protein
MRSRQVKRWAWKAGVLAVVCLLMSPGCGNDAPPATGAAAKVDALSKLSVPKEKDRRGVPGQPDMSVRELRDLKRKAMDAGK